MKNPVYRTLIFCIALMAATSAWAKGKQIEKPPVPLDRQIGGNNDKGFTGLIVPTAIANWKAAWESDDNVPFIPKAEQVEYNKPVTILLFFSNPKKDAKGNIKLTCDLSFKGKDASGETQTYGEKGLDCAHGQLTGDPGLVYLAIPFFLIENKPGDPPGKWIIEATIRDDIGGAEVHLESDFEYLAEKKQKK